MRLVVAEFAFAGIVALTPATIAHAAWSSDPAVSFPVITGAPNQRFPAAIPDGGGGVFIAWYDNTLGLYNGHVVVQHLLAIGELDPAWPAAGRSAGASTMQASWTAPAIVSDGAGGALVGFLSTQSDGHFHPRANRVLDGAGVDPGWDVDGQPLCLSSYDQYAPSAQPDLAGGATIAWEDYRGATGYDIYAARVFGNGVVNPTSPYPGTPVCTAGGDQRGPMTVSDGAGGALVFWTDYRTGGSGQIYGQHILSSGSMDPAWPADGMIVYVNSRTAPIPVADGSGGALVACNAGGVFVYHVLANGTSDPAWPANGVVIPASVVTTSRKSSVSDGAGGVIVVWADNFGPLHVRAQHTLGAGTIDASWPAGGREVPGSLVGNNQATVAVSDGSGGVVIAWSDDRTNTTDVYAQHILGNGTLDPAFPAGGRVVSTSPGSEISLALAPASGGAIAVWERFRNGNTGDNFDIYAQHISLGSLVAVEAGTGIAVTRLNRVTPSPARSSATLSWSLAGATNMRLAIFDVSGRRVREIESGRLEGGDHVRSWDLRDDAGRRVPPGLYIARLDAGSRASRPFIVER